jgi:hypothetical protein
VIGLAALGGVAGACTHPVTGTGNGAAQHDQQDKGKPAQQDKGKPAKQDKHDNGAAASHGTNGNAGTSGSATQPQPISKADANTGGANGQCPGGPYCSTRDGSPSGNGNGNGKATGKPCAGCVGKADNKNPKGQMPNGSDHNAGYECDRNHGIGRSNPAHTGCRSTTPTPVTTCPSGQVMVAGTCTTPETTPPTTPPTTCSAGMVLLNGDCTTPSLATCPAGEEMVGLACVLGVSDSRAPGVTAGSAAGVPASVLGERVVRTPSVAGAASSLPFTGAPTGELLALAVTALAAGGALAAAGRRRKVA